MNEKEKKEPVRLNIAFLLEKLCQSLTENGFSHLEIGAAKPGTDGLLPIIAADDLFAKQFE